MTTYKTLSDMSLEEFLDNKIYDEDKDTEVHDTSVWLPIRVNDMVDIIRQEYKMSKRKMYLLLTEYGIVQLEKFVNSKNYKDVQMDLKRLNMNMPTSEFAGELTTLQYEIMQGTKIHKHISLYHKVSGQISELSDVLMLTPSKITILSIIFGAYKYKNQFSMMEKTIANFSDYLFTIRRYYYITVSEALRAHVPILWDILTPFLEQLEMLITENNQDLLKLLLPVISEKSTDEMKEMVNITIHLVKMYGNNCDEKVIKEIQKIYMVSYIFFRDCKNINDILDEGASKINKILEDTK